jgi:hypothetical protein
VDFVVAGFGLGAVAVLIGFAVMDLGPLLRRSQGKDSPSFVAWIGLCREIGNALVLGGVAVCLSTLIALAAGLSDANGTRLVLGVGLVALLAAVGLSLHAARKFKLAEMERNWYAYRAQAAEYEVESRQVAVEATPIDSVEEPAIADAPGEPESAIAAAVDPEPVDTDAADPVSESEIDEPGEDVVLAVGLAPAPVDEPAPEPEPLAELEPKTEEPEEAIDSPPPVSRSNSIFQSPLLADLNGAEQAPANGAGFKSKLFADLEPEKIEGPDERGGYSSWILADLGDETAEDDEPDDVSRDRGDELPVWTRRASRANDPEESPEETRDRRSRRMSRFDRR